MAEYLGQSASFSIEMNKIKDDYVYFVKMSQGRSEDLEEWEEAKTEFKLTSKDSDRGFAEVMETVVQFLASHDNDMFKMIEDEQNNSNEGS